MLTPDALKNALAQFYGTEQWHRWSILFNHHLLTDGVKWLCDNAGNDGAYWLVDAITSHHGKCMKDPMLRDMQFWTLKTDVEKHTAVLTCERDENNVAFRQVIPYTDFQLPEIKIWVAPSGPGSDGKMEYVLYLPSEH